MRFFKSRRQEAYCQQSLGGEVESPGKVKAGVNYFIDKRAFGQGDIHIYKRKAYDCIAEYKQKQTYWKNRVLFKVRKGENYIHRKVGVIKH